MRTIHGCKQAKRKEWAAIQDSSSSDEDAKRIIKSEKDKRWESLREIITKLHQHQKNQDYAEIDEGEITAYEYSSFI